MLRQNGFSYEQIEAIVRDFRHAGLDAVEVAIMAFAENVIRAPHDTSIADADALRSHGLTDQEILDITLVAGARAFFSKVIDAMGVEPDPARFQDFPASLLDAVTVGRPFPPSR